MGYEGSAGDAVRGAYRERAMLYRDNKATASFAIGGVVLLLLAFLAYLAYKALKPAADATGHAVETVDELLKGTKQVAHEVADTAGKVTKDAGDTVEASSNTLSQLLQGVAHLIPSGSTTGNEPAAATASPLLKGPLKIIVEDVSSWSPSWWTAWTGPTGVEFYYRVVDELGNPVAADLQIEFTAQVIAIQRGRQRDYYPGYGRRNIRADGQQLASITGTTSNVYQMKVWAEAPGYNPSSVEVVG